MNENKARHIVKVFFKQLFILGLFLAISFLVKNLANICYKSIYSPPVVSEDVQQKFNHDIMEKRKLSPGHISFGLNAIELGYGDWKFDDEIIVMEQLFMINDEREAILNSKARDFSSLIFIVFLIGLPVIWYAHKLIIWLYPKEGIHNNI